MLLNNRWQRKRGLAFLPALILFVILIVLVGTMVVLIAKAAQRVINPPPYEGPTTNTLPDQTFTMPFASLQSLDGAPIPQEDIDYLAEVSADPAREFEVVVLRSTNLIHWEFMVRTNTVNHQVVWDDALPMQPAVFYRPLIVIP